MRVNFFGFKRNTKRLSQKHTIKNRPAFIRKELRYDKKSAFKETLKDYKLSENDISKIMEYIEKHKKKK